MTDTTAGLFLAAMLGALALLALLGARAVNHRLSGVAETLRRADARLVEQTPLLADRFASRRARLGDTNAATERALWSLSRLDEQVDAARLGLVARRTQLDDQRVRIIAARAGVKRIKSGARMLVRAIELRRAIL